MLSADKAIVRNAPIITGMLGRMPFAQGSSRAITRATDSTIVGVTGGDIQMAASLMGYLDGPNSIQHFSADLSLTKLMPRPSAVAFFSSIRSSRIRRY